MGRGGLDRSGARGSTVDQPPDLAAGDRAPARRVLHARDAGLESVARPGAGAPVPSGVRPVKWRGWWDFGTGALGDIACHSMDASFWTLNLGYPTRIEAESTKLYPETAPACSRI